MGFLSPKIDVPTPPPIPPSATPPTLANASNTMATQNKKSQAAGAIGNFDQTLSTTPLGGGNPATAKTSLLGA